ncbi:cbb3-type cytochrome c oxidase subunit I [Ehrlichia ruminantium]|nr:cbb3-type cytochrome c oxidase subunit I [Ehrlichia ruminantium]
MSYINNYNINLYRKWLLLGISALAISGILSIFIVLLRLPISKSFFVDVNKIFDTSLVIHVNLSVLVWGCSIISMISSFLISNSKYSRYFKYLCYSAFTGTLLMLLSVFFQNAEPIKNNYIPIINNQYFLLGLLTFIMSILCYSILSTKCHGSKILKGIALGVHGTSIILTCAILCFSMSYYTIHTQKYSPVLFYEYMFWGGGHVLQLAFSQTLLLVYLIILEQKSKFLKGTTVNIIFIVNTLSTIFTPLVYISHSADSQFIIDFFTWHMRIAGGFIPIYLFIFALFNLKTLLKPEYHSLICAILLFNYGGILGILSIQGNVTIPAHYHGSIVGMTIAFMGLIYWIIPKIGFHKINTTIANIQIYTYSLGQFLHITGLELLGGYGAIRKVTHLPDTASKIAQHCFTFGGLMAIIGGCLFVILVLLQACKKRSHI